MLPVLHGVGMPAMAPLGAAAFGLWFALLVVVVWLGSRRRLGHLQTASALEGATVGDVALGRAVAVPAHASLAEAESCCFRRVRGETLPVVRGAAVIGVLGRRDLRRHPAADRHRVSVQGAMRPLPPPHVVGPRDALSTAWARMASTGSPSLLVVEGGELRGVLTAQEIQAFAHDRLSRPAVRT